MHRGLDLAGVGQHHGHGEGLAARQIRRLQGGFHLGLHHRHLVLDGKPIDAGLETGRARGSGRRRAGGVWMAAAGRYIKGALLVDGGPILDDGQRLVAEGRGAVVAHLAAEVHSLPRAVEGPVGLQGQDGIGVKDVEGIGVAGDDLVAGGGQHAVQG